MLRPDRVDLFGGQGTERFIEILFLWVFFLFLNERLDFLVAGL